MKNLWINVLKSKNMNTENQISKNEPADKTKFNDSVLSQNIIFYKGKSYSKPPVENIDELKYYFKPKNHIEFREYYY